MPLEFSRALWTFFLVLGALSFAALSAEAQSANPNFAAGDRFAITRMYFPDQSLYVTESRIVNIDVEGYAPGPNPSSATLTFRVLDEAGNTVLTPSDETISGGSVTSLSKNIDPGPDGTLAPNQTYTLVARIIPPLSGETVTGNNSARTSFTVINPAQVLGVPDSPAWMSVLLVGVMMGWLFLSTRKRKNKIG